MEELSTTAIEKKLRFRQPVKVFFRRDSDPHDSLKDMKLTNQDGRPSFFTFLKKEITRDYLLENDEERFSAGREKFYTFMKIPKEIEKFMIYGVMHCIDNFLYVFTFLPFRVLLTLSALTSRLFHKCFRFSNRNGPVLNAAETCDLLKTIIIILCTMGLWIFDNNMMYHLIKSQSVIKLYIFYNMLDIGDKLLISFGQDTLDALFWTAAEPKGRKREHLGVIPHLLLAVIYVLMHCFMILFQATTLNVAINANNKALLTIMMSNNFVELKGGVFKKFDKNNLFQVSCSDVRERFHLVILLFIVILQTMKACGWKTDVLYQLLFDSSMVLVAELLVDWIKHAFITRFNELPLEVYRDYRTSLAYDLSQKHAFSGHSDLIARRMGFIPIPLSIVVTRVILTCIHIQNIPAVIIFLLGYLCLWFFKILIIILIFGKACSIITQHKLERTAQSSPANQDKSRSISTSPQHAQNELPKNSILKNSSSDSKTADILFNPSSRDINASAIFANSTVDLKDAKLNEELLRNSDQVEQTDEEIMTRSVPDMHELRNENIVCLKEDVESLKKSQSEPSLNVE